MVHIRESPLLIFLYLTLFLFVILLKPVLTSACNCDVPDTAAEALDSANAVFKGKVINLKEEIMDGEKYNVALISVSESWKGNIDSQVIVYTDWTSCQFDFEKGKEYLLYPYKHNGKFEVINCGRNAEINDAQEDLLELGAGKKPINTVQLEDDFQKGNTEVIISFMLLIFVVSATVFFKKEKELKGS